MIVYSPLGRGFLTGRIQSPDGLEPGDYRRRSPRFQGENFYKNLQLVERVKQVAAEKQITPSQLALAWLLAQGEDIDPSPARLLLHQVLEDLADQAPTPSAGEGFLYTNMDLIGAS